MVYNIFFVSTRLHILRYGFLEKDFKTLNSAKLSSEINDFPITLLISNPHMLVVAILTKSLGLI